MAGGTGQLVAGIVTATRAIILILTQVRQNKPRIGVVRMRSQIYGHYSFDSMQFPWQCCTASYSKMDPPLPTDGPMVKVADLADMERNAPFLSLEPEPALPK
jgi:hypothetical protein